METYVTNIYLTIGCIFWIYLGLITVDGLLTQLLKDLVRYRWLRITIKIISVLVWPLTLICLLIGVIGYLLLDSDVCKRFFE